MIWHIHATLQDGIHTLTGYGNAKKPDVQDAVMRELQLERISQPDDAADAIALALTVHFEIPYNP
ncbi:MAG: hypothetical protein EA366_13695 [Spirulina sp. DLM2.Bin59]|nr:MAG: hypothetical protein EA366_13695 [Spirulina sp. DLM2.Bin59]